MVEKNKTLFIFLFILILAGVALTLFSSPKKSEPSEESMSVFNETQYEKELEEKLVKLVENIDGVGKVSVMITLEGSAVYSFAQDLNENVSADGTLKTQASVVLSNKGSNVKEAIISGYSLPKVKGAAVVCEKKLNAVVLEKVIGVVSASLGISTDKIFVTN